MTVGLIGRKVGMTRVFTEEGKSIPVTVVQVLPNKVTQVKSVQTDGYNAIQVTTGSQKNVNKPMAGHFAKAGVEAGKGLWEFRLTDGSEDYAFGHELTVALFEAGQKVDVTGVSKGKGYAGVVKRHNFRTQDTTHGNSLAHRAPGSTGQNQTPGKVFKGKRMAGQMGAKKRTTHNLEIVRVESERNLLLIRGALPGMPGGNVIVKPAVKAKRSAATAA